MKSVQIGAYGPVDEVVEVVDDATEPTSTSDQVQLSVHAASLNPADAKLVEGMFQNPDKPLAFPATLGSDVAGVITKLGDGVTDLAVGDVVYGSAGILSGGSGSFAEVAVATVDRIAHAPKGLTHDESASLPLVGVSALMAIVEHMELKAGQKILIHGGAGGIGSLAIQLARHLGAHVATTVGAADTSYVRELGANEVIDYKAGKFDDKLRDYDAVFDTVGGETYERSFTILKQGGILVSMLEQPNEELMKQHSVRAIFQFTKVDRDRLTKLTDLIEAGALKPQVAKSFPLDQIQKAFQELATHPRGKVVLSVH